MKSLRNASLLKVRTDLLEEYSWVHVLWASRRRYLFRVLLLVFHFRFYLKAKTDAYFACSSLSFFIKVAAWYPFPTRYAIISRSLAVIFEVSSYCMLLLLSHP